MDEIQDQFLSGVKLVWIQSFFLLDWLPYQPKNPYQLYHVLVILVEWMDSYLPMSIC